MGEKRSFEREAMDGRTGERTRMCKLAYLRRLRSHQLCFEGLSVMLGWRWESPERGQRQPLFGCSRQREKP
jgi:hypothetical protein